MAEALRPSTHLAGNRVVRQEADRLLSHPPFPPERARETQHRHRIPMLLDWLEDQSGWTWHKRWQASGVEQAGAAWRPVIGQWLRERGLHTAWRIRALGPALGTVISADLLRPSMDWLAVMPTNGRGWPAAWRASVMLKALRGWKNRTNRLRASEYFMAQGGPGHQRFAGCRWSGAVRAEVLGAG
ncbi:MAG TPA: hypothetical protein VE196_02195 [Pseudonocardiaceae bacterium]|nr:hypothetical protein [Pseudonocardiaceae bacterium]